MAYNPDQPRDETGKWSPTGAAGAKLQSSLSKIESAHGGARPSGNNPGSTDVHAAALSSAQQLRSRAQAVEPSIRRDVQATISAVRGAEMVGLGHSVKGEESLTRKIRDDAIKFHGGDVAASTGTINDSVRYTMQVREAEYSASVTKTLSQLEAKGHTVERFTNTWGTGRGSRQPAYMGVNTVIRAPNGHKYELQFHTPASFRTKEVLNHKSYETARALGVSSVRRRVAIRSMQANFAKVTLPPGIVGLKYKGVGSKG